MRLQKGAPAVRVMVMPALALEDCLAPALLHSWVPGPTPRPSTTEPQPCPPTDPLQVAAAVGCFHVLCGIAAGAVSGMRGERWAPRVAKVLAVGFLALVEVVLLPDGSDKA